jgi:hypothetical protein
MRYRPRRMAAFGATGGATAPVGSTGSTRAAGYSFAQKVARSSAGVGYIPQSGVEENQGNPYEFAPEVQAEVQRALNPGIDTPGYVNPYRTVMYSVTGIGTSNPVQALTGNPARTYLLVQNLGPGNLFLGIGVSPIAGGANVLNLIQTQLYEQIGGGFFLPPNPWFPYGISICASFVSSEYVSLLADQAGTAAMVIEGSWNGAASGINLSAS